MRSLAFTFYALAALGFCLGFLSGCGEITATTLDPPAAAGPDASLEPPAANLPVQDAGAGATLDAAAAGGDTAATIQPEAGAGELGAPEAPPEHPALRCQGASTDYRLAVCKPGCGTCGKLGEASTYIAGCWTSDDFHCVDSCADCR